MVVAVEGDYVFDEAELDFTDEFAAAEKVDKLDKLTLHLIELNNRLEELRRKQTSTNENSHVLLALFASNYCGGTMECYC